MGNTQTGRSLGIVMGTWRRGIKEKWSRKSKTGMEPLDWHESLGLGFCGCQNEAAKDSQTVHALSDSIAAKKRRPPLTTLADAQHPRRYPRNRSARLPHRVRSCRLGPGTGYAGHHRRRDAVHVSGVRWHRGWSLPLGNNLNVAVAVAVAV